MKKIVIPIVASVFIVLFFTGFHIHITNQVNNALFETNENFQIHHFSFISSHDTPTRWTYRVDIKTSNPTSILVNYSFSEPKVFLDGHTLGILPVGDWHGSVKPDSEISFSGDITIHEVLMSQILDRGEVELQIQAKMESSASSFWISKNQTQNVVSTQTIMFS